MANWFEESNDLPLNPETDSSATVENPLLRTFQRGLSGLTLDGTQPEQILPRTLPQYSGTPGVLQGLSQYTANRPQELSPEAQARFADQYQQMQAQQTKAQEPQESGAGLGDYASAIGGGLVKGLADIGPTLYGAANALSYGYLDEGRRNLQAGAQNLAADLTGNEALRTRSEDITPFAVGRAQTQEVINNALASNELKRRQENLKTKEGWDYFKEVITDPLLLSEAASQSLPYTLPIMGGARVASQAVLANRLAAAEKIADPVAKAAALKAAQEAAKTAATRAAIGMNLPLSGGSSALDAQQQIYQSRELPQTPDYQTLQQQGMNDQQIREELARRSGLTTFALAGTLGTAASMLARGGVEGQLARLTVDSVSRKVADRVANEGVKAFTKQALISAVNEGAEEFLQSGGEQFGTNVGLKQAGLNQDVFKDVLSSAALGAVLGGITGGGLGAVGQASQKAYDHWAQNPRDAAGIIDLASQPNVRSMLPDTAVSNLVRLGEFLNERNYGGGKLTAALTELANEQTQRANEPATEKQQRQRLIAAVQGRIPAQALGTMTDGVAQGDLDVTQLQAQKPIFGLAGDAFQAFRNQKAQQRAQQTDWYGQNAETPPTPSLPLVDDFGREVDPTTGLPKPPTAPGLNQVTSSSSSTPQPKPSEIKPNIPNPAEFGKRMLEDALARQKADKEKAGTTPPSAPTGLSSIPATPAPAPIVLNNPLTGTRTEEAPVNSGTLGLLDALRQITAIGAAKSPVPPIPPQPSDINAQNFTVPGIPSFTPNLPGVTPNAQATPAGIGPAIQEPGSQVEPARDQESSSLSGFNRQSKVGQSQVPEISGQGPSETGVIPNASSLRENPRFPGQGRESGQPEVQPGSEPSGGNLRQPGENPQGAQPAGEVAQGEVETAPPIVPVEPAPAPTPATPSVAEQGEGTPTPKPFGDIAVEDESKVEGARVRVLPGQKGETPYFATVQRALNGGTLIEVQPDGMEGSFRIPGERIVVEAAIPTPSPTPPENRNGQVQAETEAPLTQGETPPSPEGVGEVVTQPATNEVFPTEVVPAKKPGATEPQQSRVVWDNGVAAPKKLAAVKADKDGRSVEISDPFSGVGKKNLTDEIQNLRQKGDLKVNDQFVIGDENYSESYVVTNVDKKGQVTLEWRQDGKLADTYTITNEKDSKGSFKVKASGSDKFTTLLPLTIQDFSENGKEKRERVLRHREVQAAEESGTAVTEAQGDQSVKNENKGTVTNKEKLAEKPNAPADYIKPKDKLEAKTRVSKLEASIREGEQRLRSKVNGIGEKLSAGALSGIEKEVSRAQEELNSVFKDFPGLQQKVDTTTTEPVNNLVIWGYKPGNEPIKLGFLTKKDRAQREKEGWKTAAYEVGVEPTGLLEQARDSIRKEMNDLTESAKNRFLENHSPEEWESETPVNWMTKEESNRLSELQTKAGQLNIKIASEKVKERKNKKTTKKEPSEQPEPSAPESPASANITKTKPVEQRPERLEPWSRNFEEYEISGAPLEAELYDGLEIPGTDGFKVSVIRKEDGRYDVAIKMPSGRTSAQSTDVDYSVARDTARRAYGQGNPFNSATDTAKVIQNHRGLVDKAIKDGKEVPEKVFNDYPDLRKKNKSEQEINNNQTIETNIEEQSEPDPFAPNDEADAASRRARYLQDPEFRKAIADFRHYIGYAVKGMRLFKDGKFIGSQSYVPHRENTWWPESAGLRKANNLSEAKVRQALDRFEIGDAPRKAGERKLLNFLIDYHEAAQSLKDETQWLEDQLSSEEQATLDRLDTEIRAALGDDVIYDVLEKLGTRYPDATPAQFNRALIKTYEDTLNGIANTQPGDATRTEPTPTETAGTDTEGAGATPGAEPLLTTYTKEQLDAENESVRQAIEQKKQADAEAERKVKQAKEAAAFQLTDVTGAVSGQGDLLVAERQKQLEEKVKQKEANKDKPESTPDTSAQPSSRTISPAPDASVQALDALLTRNDLGDNPLDHPVAQPLVDYAAEVRNTAPDKKTFTARLVAALGNKVKQWAKALWEHTGKALALVLSLNLATTPNFTTIDQAQATNIAQTTLAAQPTPVIQAVQVALTPPAVTLPVDVIEQAAQPITVVAPPPVAPAVVTETARERFQHTIDAARDMGSKVKGTEKDTDLQWQARADAAIAKANRGERLTPLEMAWTLYGEHEYTPASDDQEGRPASPAIQKILDYFGSRLSQDRYPWCAPFMSYVHARAGIPLKVQGARAFLQQGKPVTMADAREGDILVMRNSNPDTGGWDGYGGHVAIIVKRDGDVFWGLGGNQGNEVNVSLFHSDRILGVRRIEASAQTKAATRVAQAATPTRAKPSRATTSAPGVTRPGFITAIRQRFPHLSGALDKMLVRGEQGQKGGLVLVDSADLNEIARVFAEKTGRTQDQAVQELRGNGVLQGLYDPRTGLTLAILPNLSEATAPAVFVHEVAHSQQRQEINDAAQKLVDNRAQEPRPALRQFLNRVQARLEAAGAANDPNEVVNYLVEEAILQGRQNGFSYADGRFLDWVSTTISPKVADILRRLVNAMRGWAIRHGYLLKSSQLTVDDLLNWALAGVERAAVGDVRIANEGAVTYATKSDADLRDLAIRNIQEGIWSFNKVLDTQETVHSALYRPEVGWIDFDYGKPGIPEKDYKRGYGISHLLARRGVVEGRDLQKFGMDLIKTLALGTASNIYGYPGDPRVNITLNNMIATVSLRFFGNQRVWLLTGFYDKNADVTGRDVDLLGTTQAEPYFTRLDLGAALSTRLTVPEDIGKIVDEIGVGQFRSSLTLASRRSQQSGATFYSALLKTIETLKQPKAPGPQWASILDNLVKKGQVKQEELDWSGVKEWLQEQKRMVGKDEVLGFVRDNNIRVEETEIGLDITKHGSWNLAENADQTSETKVFDWVFKGQTKPYVSMVKIDDNEWQSYIYGRNDQPIKGSFDEVKQKIEEYIQKTISYQDKPRNTEWTLPGNENQRELVLTVPTIEPWNTDDTTHYGDIGGGRAVAWVRFNDRMDEDGKKTLFIEEIQSKRHQEGREKGYKYLTKDEMAKKLALDEKPANQWSEEEIDWYNRRVNDQVYYGNGIPNAPFKQTISGTGTTLSGWAGLAFKRMLRYAAENGYDRVAWTTGEQQNKRYDLSKQVGTIYYFGKDVGIGEGTLIATRVGETLDTPNGRPLIEQDNVSQDKIHEYIGVENAQKLLESQEKIISKMLGRELAGTNLTVGGSGMKGFYDRLLPNEINKYIKKWGTQVGTTRINTGEAVEAVHSVDVTPAMVASVMQGQPLFSRGQPENGAPTPAELAEAQRQYDTVVAAYTNPDGTKKPGWMKAPNGQPTNLNERQWVQTRTPNFIAWFGDFINDPANASKVVDANGEPLVVYHGTDTDFSRFDRSYLGDNTLSNASDEWFGETSRIGFWFNTQPMTSTKNSPYSVNMPAFLNIRSVYLDQKTLSDLAGELENRQTTGEEFKKQIEIEGYDGIMVEDDEFGGQSFIVFNGQQIKSATDNTGTFSPTNPDIRYSSPTTPAPARVSVSAITDTLIAPVRAAWTRAGLDVQVVQSVRDLPNNLQAALVDPQAEGFYELQAGRIYLIADNLSSLERAKEVLAHETIGHWVTHALRNVTEFLPVLRALERLEQVGNRDIAAIAKYIDQAQPGLDKYARAEEIYAVAIERGLHEKISLLRAASIRLLQHLKAFLRRLGFDNAWVNNLTLNDVLLFARESQQKLARGERSTERWAFSSSPSMTLAQAQEASPSTALAYSRRAPRAGDNPILDEANAVEDLTQQRGIMQRLREDGVWTVTKDLARHPIKESRLAWQKLLTLQQVVELNQDIPGVGELMREFERIALAMDADKAELKQRAFTVVDKMRRELSSFRARDRGRKLGLILQLGTFYNVRPDVVPYSGDPQENAKLQEVYQRMKTLMAELQKEQPKLAEVYFEIMGRYNAQGQLEPGLIESMDQIYRQALEDRLGRNAVGVVREMMEAAKDQTRLGTRAQLRRLFETNPAAYNALDQAYRQFVVAPNPSPAQLQQWRDGLSAEAQAVWDELLYITGQRRTNKVKSLWRNLKYKAEHDKTPKGKPIKLVAGTLAERLRNFQQTQPRAYQELAQSLNSALSAYFVDDPQTHLVNKQTLTPAAKALYDAVVKQTHDAVFKDTTLVKALDEARVQAPQTNTTLTGQLRQLWQTDSAAFDTLLDLVEQRLSITNHQGESAQERQDKETARAALRQQLDQQPAVQRLFDQLVDSAIKRVENSIAMARVLFENNRLNRATYFPLDRFGRYQVYAEKAEQGKDGYGFPTFATFATEAEAQQAINLLKKDGWTVRAGFKIEQDLLHRMPPTSSIGRLFAQIDLIQGEAAANERLKREVWEMYLRSLPDISVRKHLMARKNIPGFSQDALQSLARLMNSKANAIARLRHSDQLDNALIKMRRVSRKMEENTDLLPQVVRANTGIQSLQDRYEWMLNPTNANWANFLTSLGFFWHLTNISTALVNLTQTPIWTFADLGAKFGATKAFVELNKTIKDYGLWKFRIDKSRLGKIEQEFGGDLGRGLERAIRSGGFSRTETVSLAGMGEDALEFKGGNFGTAAGALKTAWQKIFSAMSWLYQKSEVANREINFIAAYRLARRAAEQEAAERAAQGKTAMTPAQIHEHAYQVAFSSMLLAQGNYANFNRAPFMQGDFQRIFLLFRTYSQMMTFRMLRDAHQGLQFESLNQATKALAAAQARNDEKAIAQAKQGIAAVKQARARLGLMTASAALWGGAVGLPIYSVMVGLINALFGSDPDDPWDVEEDARHWLRAMVGQEAQQGVMNGLIGNLFGIDIAPRVSADLWRLWVRPMPGDLVGTDAFYWMLLQMGGPLVGTAANIAKSYQDYQASGYDPIAAQRAAEATLPAPARNLIKAARYGTSGVTTRKGDLVVPEISPMETFMQGIGFTPARVSEQFKDNTEQYNLKTALERRRKALKDRYIYAVWHEDQDLLNTTLGWIETFNAKNPEIAITSDSLSQAYREFVRARTLQEQGVYVPSKGMRARLNREEEEE